MHCVECNSENMRMRGSISNPRWQCADCGSARPPVHAHDRLPEAEPIEQCCCGETDDAWRLCPVHGGGGQGYDAIPCTKGGPFEGEDDTVYHIDAPDTGPFGMGVDPGADDSTAMWAIDADTGETQSYSIDASSIVAGNMTTYCFVCYDCGGHWDLSDMFSKAGVEDLLCEKCAAARGWL